MMQCVLADQHYELTELLQLYGHLIDRVIPEIPQVDLRPSMARGERLVLEETQQGNTLVSCALRCGHFRCVRVLFLNGASRDGPAATIFSPIYFMAGSPDAIEKLVEMDGRLRGTRMDLKVGNRVTGDTVLHRVAEDPRKIHLGSIRVLCTHDAALVHTANKKGETPLHVVSCARYAQALLQHGASADAVDANGETPLHSACVAKAKGNLIKLLITPTNFNHRCSQHGFTPMHHTLFLANSAFDNYATLEPTRLWPPMLSTAPCPELWARNNIKELRECIQKLLTLGARINTLDMDTAFSVYHRHCELMDQNQP